MSRKKKISLNSWGELRFSIVGGLLASPPEEGKLVEEILKLARRSYQHPFKEKEISFGASTIERWYYKAANADDPLKALERKRRSDAGLNRAMSEALIKELGLQYKRYPQWSYQLHFDNLSVLVEEHPELGNKPSYSTVRRRMKEKGWLKKKSRRGKFSKGRRRAVSRLESREVRSYDMSHVHSLWHLDFHHGKCRVIDSNGQWHSPIVLCVLDDRSRLCCHIQWYLNETAEVLYHCLVQAFHKRGLPRSLMTDNGAAMVAQETLNGLSRLSILHEKTLAYSPYQNGKQESFWGQLEGRLIAMLSRKKQMSLDYLNRATQAWAELEYNRSVHEETGQSPIKRMLEGPDASRRSPEGEKLMLAFTVLENRVQRKSDGTIQIKGIRFEIPSRYRHIQRLYVRYRTWDLSTAWLVDKYSDTTLAPVYPQDKTRNAEGRRRTLEPLNEEDMPVDDTESDPPLLHKLMEEYAATGLPPAYIPMHKKGGKK